MGLYAANRSSAAPMFLILFSRLFLRLLLWTNIQPPVLERAAGPAVPAAHAQVRKHASLLLYYVFPGPALAFASSALRTLTQLLKLTWCMKHDT